MNWKCNFATRAALARGVITVRMITGPRSKRAHNFGGERVRGFSQPKACQIIRSATYKEATHNRDTEQPYGNSCDPPLFFLSNASWRDQREKLRTHPFPRYIFFLILSSFTPWTRRRSFHLPKNANRWDTACGNIEINRDINSLR